MSEYTLPNCDDDCTDNDDQHQHNSDDSDGSVRPLSLLLGLDSRHQRGRPVCSAPEQPRLHERNWMRLSGNPARFVQRVRVDLSVRCGLGDDDDYDDNLDSASDFDYRHDSDGVPWKLRLGVGRCAGPARQRMVWRVASVYEQLPRRPHLRMLRASTGRRFCRTGSAELQPRPDTPRIGTVLPVSDYRLRQSRRDIDHDHGPANHDADDFDDGDDQHDHDQHDHDHRVACRNV